MPQHISLGRIFGVQIGLHFSWVIIATLITLSLAAQFRFTNPEWGTAVIWAAAIITALLFFVTLLLHELSHALVAKSRGIPVRSITLFALGGVANIERESADAKGEFWMGIVGPITSAAIGFLCLGAAYTLGWVPRTAPDSPLLAVFVWLGYINIVLAIFNMIPGFPLDGGRVLRAIIWWITKSEQRATRIAARVGQVIAVLFILAGAIRFFTLADFGGLWMALIGWFLYSAATASISQMELLRDLRNVRVNDVMATSCTRIDAGSTIQQFVDEHLLRGEGRCYFVDDAGSPAGLITVHEVKNVPRQDWSLRRIRDVMLPLDRVHTVQPSTPITEALEKMGRDDVNQLPVVREGHLEGMVSRQSVLRFLQLRTELHL